MASAKRLAKACVLVIVVAAVSIGVAPSACAADMSAADNEAVYVSARTGARSVELPPGSGAGGSRRLSTPFTDPGGEVFMIESQNGLVECSQSIYRDNECRVPTFGHGKRPRTWIVKRHGKWLQCSRPARDAVCAGIGEMWLNPAPSI